jgi:uncharacterized OB-fold protein
MTDTIPLRPLPTPTRDSAPYWQGLLEGRLMLQSCDRCGKVRHYPRPVCDACYCMDVRWIEAKGTGTVHSWTVCHHPYHPAFKGEVPYTLVLVDLPEGVRMNVPLQGAGGAGSRIGAPVRIVAQRVTDDIAVPVAVPAK